MTPRHHRARTVADGFRLPESLRWREGQLWLSDMDGQAIFTVGTDGPELVCELPAQPSGLGWDPGGALLIVSQLDALLLRYDGASLHEVADLGPAVRSRGGDVRPNDMYVDAHGTAYIGSASFQVVGDRLVADDSCATPLLQVTREGAVHTLTDALKCPNGIVPAPNGAGLIVAETRADRLVAVTPHADGTSAQVREYARCAAGPDGICVDASGAVWAAFPFSGVVQRLGQDGAVLEEIDTGGRVPLDCVLGGATGTTLFVASVAEIDHLGTSRTGRVDAYERNGPVTS